MKILTTSATLALLICNQSHAASSMEDHLTPFARSSINEIFPEGLPRSTPEDIQTLTRILNVQIPTELEEFFLKFSHIGFTCFEVVLPQSMFHEYTVKTIMQAWDRGVPKEYLPFCRDSSDYYCIHLEMGHVKFWDGHEQAFSDNPNDMWSSFNEWVVKAWIPLMDNFKKRTNS